MKRLLLCLLMFAGGFASGTTIRVHQVWRSAYCRGYVTAIDRFQQLAVREGHGHWEWEGKTVSFRWNNVRPEYRPDSPSRIPGIE